MASDLPKISVIIVSWNVSDSLSRCLASVFATQYPHLEVLVIDNASTDNSVEVVHKFPAATLIKNSNVGFPKAVNMGLTLGTGDYYLVLNPDTRLPANFFTHILQTIASFPRAGVIGPKLVNPDGSTQGSVFPEPSLVRAFQEFWLKRGPLTQKYTPSGSLPVSVNAVSGACMFIPKTVVQQIGQFTHRVFMYYEDLDFCRRIRQTGLQVIFDPAIKVVHEHGSSSEKSSQSQSYLNASSLWYNGWVKYHLLTLIIKVSKLL